MSPAQCRLTGGIWATATTDDGGECEFKGVNPLVDALMVKTLDREQIDSQGTSLLHPPFADPLVVNLFVRR